jgi:hypothetical protein
MIRWLTRPKVPHERRALIDAYLDRRSQADLGAGLEALDR